MRRRLLTNLLAGGGAFTLAFSFAFPLGVWAQSPMGRFPVCEPSAAVRVPCGEEGQACLLVGDNEEEKNLFLYRIPEQERTLEAAGEGRFSVLLPDNVGDIEAMAKLGARDVLVFGSHSRDRSCDPKGSRRRFLHARFEDGALVFQGARLLKSEKISCAGLFAAGAKRDPLVVAVCAAIDNAEEAADEATKRLQETKDKQRAEKECETAGAFNVEGAVALNTGRGNETWVGLRSPLAAYPQGSGKAVLLRMSGLEGFKFNAAAVVDFGGRGIRELAESGEWIWGIAGPVGDSDAPFSLWRFPKNRLEPGATILPEIVRPLPTSSEGLAFDGQTLWVVIDGTRGGKDGRCAQSPQFLSIPGS